MFGRLTNEEVVGVLATVGQEVSKDTVRRYRGGLAERIAADFVADVARAFQVNPAWLLTGEGEMKPARAEDQGRGGSVASISDGERLQILTLLDVVRALVVGPGRKAVTPPVSPETLRYYRIALRRLDEIRQAAERLEVPPTDPGHTGTAG
ncbi:MAG: hypothetical protein M3R06_08330 [Chloroflexota bacterium]|nr:hypothetical protein [Chloroflexota bacterium]